VTVSLYALLYIRGGNTNAKAVHAKAPVRFTKRPNLGTTIALTAVSMTTKDLKTSDFNTGNFGLVGNL